MTVEISEVRKKELTKNMRRHLVNYIKSLRGQKKD